MELISVIMPFYQSEKYICEAIESVCSQTYPNWELLLVDDGSQDRSAELVRSFLRRYPQKMRYLAHSEHQHRGGSAARNLGIRQARGSFIAFLDSDDVWLPTKLEDQLEILTSHPEAGMVYGNTLFWYSWTGKPEDQARDHLPPLGVGTNTLLQPPELLQKCLQGKAAVPCTCSLLIRRPAIEQAGLFEEAFRSVFTDQVFYTKLFLRTPVYVAEGCWDKYRRRPDSSWSSIQGTGKEITARGNYLSWVEKYFLEENLKGSELWQGLQKQIWLNRHPRTDQFLRSSRRFWRKVLAGSKSFVISFAFSILPEAFRSWLKAKLNIGQLPVNVVNFGSLRRLKPVSDVFGYDRGAPIDRYYIEQFLSRNSEDIHGRVLEIGDNTYTARFGGERVSNSDVLHISKDAPGATIVADLTSASHIPSDRFDCIIFTQTLHLIFDVRAAIRTLHRILKPGGVLLATFPGISQIDRGRWKKQWYWSFTTYSARLLFEEAFPHEKLSIQSYGNVLSAVSFLEGLAQSELSRAELDYDDPQFQVLISLRAVK